jgi:hypothetical protein
MFLKISFFVATLKVNDENSRIRIQDLDPDPYPDPLVRGMDPRIRIHTKISWICNTARNSLQCNKYAVILDLFKENRKAFFLRKTLQ